MLRELCKRNLYILIFLLFIFLNIVDVLITLILGNITLKRTSNIYYYIMHIVIIPLLFVLGKYTSKKSIKVSFKQSCICSLVVFLLSLMIYIHFGLHFVTIILPLLYSLEIFSFCLGMYKTEIERNH